MDRPLYNDHNAMKKLVKSGEILEEVEKVVGELEYTQRAIHLCHEV